MQQAFSKIKMEEQQVTTRKSYLYRIVVYLGVVKLG